MTRLEAIRTRNEARSAAWDVVHGYAVAAPAPVRKMSSSLTAKRSEALYPRQVGVGSTTISVLLILAMVLFPALFLLAAHSR